MPITCFTKPRRFKILSDIERPFERAYRFGVYFPDTDLCVFDMGQRGTGMPTKDFEWIDPKEDNETPKRTGI